jgi:hypothetical protein
MNIPWCQDEQSREARILLLFFNRILGTEPILPATLQGINIGKTSID